MNESIAAAVLGMIATYTDVPVDQIALDSSFEELGLDSLDALSIVTDFENAFNVRIPNEAVFQIDSVRQAVESLEQYRAAQGAPAETESDSLS